MIQAGSGFNYGYGNNPNDPTRSAGLIGDTPFGPGFGYSFGNSALNAASTGFSTINGLGMGAGLLSMFGVGGKGMETFGRLAGGLGFSGMVMPMLAPMAISHALSSMAHGATQQMGVHNIMNQMAGQRNMGGFGGMGVNSQSAQMMTETIRNIAAIPDMMTNQGELTNILKSLSNMKMMQSVKSAKEMSSKFSSLVGTVREMAKDLNTSLENVMPYIEQFNNQGYFKMEDIRRNANQTHTTAGVGIGMNERNLVQVQGAGADMVRSGGGRARIGSEGMRNMVGQVSVGVSNGIINEEDIHRITGKRGEEGVAEMSTRLMGVNMQLMQSQGFGDILTGVLGKQDKEGNFTGEMDQNMLKDLQSGRLTMDDMHRIFSDKMSKGKNAAVTFKTAQARGMSSEFASALGPTGTKKAIDALINDKMMSDEEKKLALSNFVKEDMALIDAMFKLNEQSAKMSSFLESEMESVAKRNKMMSALKMRSLGAKYQRFKTSVGHVLSTPFEEAGSSFITHFGDVGDLMSADLANGNYGNAFLRGVGGLFGIQPTVIKGSVAGVKDDVASRILLGGNEVKSDVGSTSGSDYIQNATSNYYNKLRKREDYSKFDKSFGRDFSSSFGHDLKGRIDFAKSDFMKSNVFDDLRSGKTAASKQVTDRARYNPAKNRVKELASEAMAKGYTGAKARRYIEDNIGYMEISYVEGGLDKVLYDLSMEDGSQIMKDSYKEMRESLYTDILSGGGGVEGSDMGFREIEQFRNDAFDTSDALTGMWDWSYDNSSLSLDSTIMKDTFGNKSSVSLSKQQELAKLVSIATTNDSKREEFIAASAGDPDKLNKWLESHGIKLTAEEIGAPMLSELATMAHEYGTLSDKKKKVATGFSEKLKNSISSQLRQETITGVTSLKKLLDGNDATGGAMKELKDFTESGDITDLEQLSDAINKEDVDKMSKGPAKEMMLEILKNKESYGKLTTDSEKRSFISERLGEQNVSAMEQAGVTLEKMSKRAFSQPVLKNIKPEGDRTIDENILKATGYSAEVAEAMTDMNSTLAGYMKEQQQVISAQMEFVNKTKEAVVTMSNATNAANKP